ncbi:hypothetical protein IAQ67_28455 (plasmid) [Paenibacillus peoriae]|uniref:Uncharacterized protein n=1 Tax=Paenibacillus peoriae TaxID=59893 RepID=A0A7H0YH90_9BACL|nr:hypothetical protein [Paenibacillus peoriae]QNR70448.1 hypothetical protein IAQ67_28455 [Paenibacillus peoriae]
MTTEARKMTIARGLTRLKTIKAQLASVGTDVGNVAVINNKKRSPMGEQKVAIDKNHNQALEAVNSLYQKFNDLIAEFTKIKLAIDKANLTTIIVIGGKSMTIQEALIYRRDIQDYVRALNNQYARAVTAAKNEVESYNRNLNTEGMDDTTLNKVMADVLYLVPPARITEVNEFLVEFMTELDGTLNEVNALTEIEVA